ncbi:MAG: hypothetical protein LBH06_08620, partial [Rikenellaceae bacterium]|nr:hypothetical protein [Rikenellaceae bacterium]
DTFCLGQQTPGYPVSSNEPRTEKLRLGFTSRNVSGIFAQPATQLINSIHMINYQINIRMQTTSNKNKYFLSQHSNGQYILFNILQISTFDFSL